MKIYLINKETNEIINEYNNVVEYTDYYIMYKAGKGISKIYVGENEYFTNTTKETEVTQNE